jgi:SAM-dependent methyltransferase
LLGGLAGGAIAGTIATLSDEPRRHAARRAAYGGVRRTALWLDDRIEGFSEPNSRIYELIFTRALGGLYERAADEAEAELASRGRRDGASILDLGCGPGRLAVELALRMPEASIIGLDLSPSMIRLAGLRESAGRGPRFMVGDAADLPFKADSFDAVVSTLSLHHWSEPAASFAEIRRVLRPGGLALVYDLRVLTVSGDALSEVALRAGLKPGELRRERLDGGPLAGLFARFRLEETAAPA